MPTLVELSSLAYERLNQSIVTVGVLIDPPYATKCLETKLLAEDPKSVHCPYPGFSYEITVAVCNLLVLNCQFILEQNMTNYGDNYTTLGDSSTNDGGGGEVMEGWNGIVRGILDEFSLPVYAERSLLITHFPPFERFKAGSALFAFSAPVWGLIILAIVTMGLLFSGIDIVSGPKKPLRGKNVWVSCLGRGIDSLAIFSAQDSKKIRASRSKANLSLFLVWALACIVLAGMYSSYIVSTALHARIDMPFTGLRSLAACLSAGTCRLVAKTLSVSYYERIFNAFEANNPLNHLKILIDGGQAPVSLHPFRHSFGILTRRINKRGGSLEIGAPENGRFNVFIGSDSHFGQLISSFPACSFHSVQYQSYDPLAFPMAKGNPLGSFLNQAIQALREAGIIGQIYKRYVGQHLESQQRCHSGGPKRGGAASGGGGSEPIPLKAFAGTFPLLLIGCIAAAAVLSVEMYIWRRQSRSLRESAISSTPSCNSVPSLLTALIKYFDGGANRNTRDIDGGMINNRKHGTSSIRSPPSFHRSKIMSNNKKKARDRQHSLHSALTNFHSQQTMFGLGTGGMSNVSGTAMTANETTADSSDRHDRRKGSSTHRRREEFNQTDFSPMDYNTVWSTTLPNAAELFKSSLDHHSVPIRKQKISTH